MTVLVTGWVTDRNTSIGIKMWGEGSQGDSKRGDDQLVYLRVFCMGVKWITVSAFTLYWSRVHLGIIVAMF